MKKQSTIALMAILLAASAEARTKSNFQDYFKKVNTLTQDAGSAHKTTATYWRIAATSTYSFSGTSLDVNDSSKYIYSNARGSAFSYDDFSVEDYGLRGTVLSDTVLKYADNGSGLQLNNRYLSSYGSNNEKMTFTLQNKMSSSFVNSGENRAVRDLNGNIIKDIYFNWTGTKWDTSSITEYSYDSQNKILSDSTYDYTGGLTTPSDKTSYSYDGNGNLVETLWSSWDGSTWIDQSRDSNTYYPNNKVKTTLSQNYVNGMWQNSYLDSNGYNSSDVYNYNLGKEWDSAGAMWYNSSRETRTIGSNGLPTAAVFSNYDTSAKSWSTQGEGMVTYDTNGNVTKVDIYAYIGGIKIPTPYYVRNFYYEYYYNVGIDKTETTAAIKVYPNPASNNLNVVLNGTKDARISLINMAGQTVRNMQADNAQKVSMNISGLPAGNYILTVQSTDLAPSRQMISIQ